jgi:hypothetical protein
MIEKIWEGHAMFTISTPNKYQLSINFHQFYKCFKFWNIFMIIFLMRKIYEFHINLF